MTDAAKKLRREYLKKWRAANPDKVRKHNENFWEKKAAELEASDEKNS